MDVILIILGVMGVGAVAISTYVFTVAARNYVSEDHKRYGKRAGDPVQRRLVARNQKDRRSGRPVTFPLAVNGILIANDRRTLPDRRAIP